MSDRVARSPAIAASVLAVSVAALAIAVPALRASAERTSSSPSGAGTLIPKATVSAPTHGSTRLAPA